MYNVYYKTSLRKSACMNKILSCLLSIAIFTSIVFGQNADWEPRFEVATWADFAQCAITHSFDDNIHLAGKELEIFDEREFNVTLFTVTTAAYWPNCIEAFDKGHEISSHGTSIDTNNTEFTKSYNDIITHVLGARAYFSISVV